MKALVLTAVLLRLCWVQSFDFIGNSSSPDVIESEPIGCDGSCVRPLLEAIQLSLYNENRTGAIGYICRSYEESAKCIQLKPHCKDYKTFIVTTSGINFMCVEKKNAFEALASCIETNFSAVKAECLKLCNFGSIATGYTLQRTPKDAPVSKLEMEMPAILTSEICRIIKCIMDCSKTNFNARCEGNAGSLLTEVVVRPFLRSQRSFVEMPMFGALAASLPIQCRFISDEQAKTLSTRMDETGVDFNPWKLAEYLSLDHLSPLEDNDALLEGRLQGMNASTSMSHQNVSIQFVSDEQATEGSGTE